MVNVEPFIFQKVTAFKERLQMVDKINEIIETLNTSVIGPDEIRQIVEDELTDYYDKAEIDQMFSTIDFSPYYTKTEVDTIVDGVEDRVQTNEDDIATLETSKQDVLTAGNSIKIENNEVSLKDWEIYDQTDWSDLFEKNGGEYFAKEDLLIGYNFANTWHKISYDFIPKGTKFEIYTNVVISPYSLSEFPVNNTMGLYTAYYTDISGSITSGGTSLWLTGLILKGNTTTNPTYYTLKIIGYGSGEVQMTGYKKIDLTSFLTPQTNVTKYYTAIFRRI